VNLLEIIVFDDQIARGWEPFALTRPVGELLFGALTLRARHEHVYRARCVGHVTSDSLYGFEEPDAPAVIRLPDPRPRAATLYLLSRFVPTLGSALEIRHDRAGPVVTASGVIVGWFDPEGGEPPDAGFILEPSSSAAEPVATVEGELIDRVWQLVSLNPDRTGADVATFMRDRPGKALQNGSYQVGKHSLFVDETATLEPGCVFVTTDGPIWIDRGVHIRAFTRLAGPAYIGPRSTLIGGSVEAVSLGPVCRVGGELAESVCLGYVNKQHDGHIGHAYLGRWVNLGAETTNSDLKNNYGTVRMWTPAGEVDTGEIKMGSLLGDHVKTGIGLLLNTGTVIGAGSSIYGTALPPTYIPAFSWGTGDDLRECRLDKFLEVAERAMARRDVELTRSMREMLDAAWHRARRNRTGGSR
jgi:UDP-N-acetylglucosamine diphosphorylase/glucosamine-1-phosphate N-acetyltransferase